MTSGQPRVGIIGATGIVGKFASALLLGRGWGNLRLGARHVDGLAGSARAGSTEVVAVDIVNEAELTRFCAGCQVVLNCAGPSYRIVDRVARAALKSGSDYVDVSGDDPAHAALNRAEATQLPAQWRSKRRVVLSAGMIAGFSNVLPRWLAGLSNMTVTRLSAQLGGAQRFTHTAAGDLVLSLLAGEGGSDSWYGETGAAWRFGKRKSRVLSTVENANLPHFRGAVTVLPFLSADAVRLAHTMGLAELDWYNVFAGEHLRTALTKLRGRSLPDSTSLNAAIEQARSAAELDLAGRNPWYSMVFTLGGFRSGKPIARTAAATCEDTYLLTAAVAALAVEDVIHARIAPGLHFADAVLGADLISRVKDLDSPAEHPIVSMDTFETAGLVSAMEDGAV